MAHSLRVTNIVLHRWSLGTLRCNALIFLFAVTLSNPRLQTRYVRSFVNPTDLKKLKAYSNAWQIAVAGSRIDEIFRVQN
jgi:hypothetical protein